MKNYSIHPVAAIFPEMPAQQFAALVADIRDSGQIEAIKLWRGLVIDGRHRLRACQELGIEPRVEEWTGDDPTAYVVSANLHRRHLDEGQRAMVAAKLANLQSQDTLKKGPVVAIGDDGKITKAQAAEMLSVGVAQVKRAKRVIEHGIPELQDAVTQGKVTVSAANLIAKIDPIEQSEVVSKGPEAVRKKAQEMREKAIERPGGEPQGHTEQKTEIVGVGVIRANEAINCLIRIPKNDQLRGRGFQVVMDWIKRNK